MVARPALTGIAVVVALILLSSIAVPVLRPAVHLAAVPKGLSADSSAADPVVISVGPGTGYSVTQISVTTSQTVGIELLQTDSTAHTLLLSPVVNFQLPMNDTPLDVYEFFNQHTPLVNLSVPAIAGASAWANFTAPSTAGTYEYLCEVPGHFQAGMHGTLTVNSPSTSGLLGALTGLIVVLIIVIIILILIAIAAVVIMRRRRQRQAPPPRPPPASEPPKSGP